MTIVQENFPYSQNVELAGLESSQLLAIFKVKYLSLVIRMIICLLLLYCIIARLLLKSYI